jgi:diaminopimelate epimerase
MKRRGRSIHFYKVSGAGNHFVLLDVRRAAAKAGRGLARGRLVRALCEHGHSVGADGVLFIERSSSADFRLVYYNSDGREAALCGNGTRCAAQYAFQQKVAPARMRIETGSGTVGAAVGRSGVELEMREPRDFRSGVAVRTSSGTVEGDFVNTGVPHFVTRVKDWRRLDVNELGRELRMHKAFGRQGANVNFVRVLRGGLVEIRTYERGVEAETLACGTGAVAAAVCLAKRRLVKPPVCIKTRGGDTLRVTFADTSNPLSMPSLHGPAQVVYEGDIAPRVLRAVRGGRVESRCR